MAISRDLWIVLRARDEATRIVRSFGGTLTSTSATAVANMTRFEQVMATAALRLNQFAQVSMLAGATMAGLGAAGLTFIHSATKVAAEYDRQVRHTLTQVDDLSISLDKLGEIGRNVAREVQVPFEDLQSTLFFIFSSINVNAEQAEKLLKGFAKEAVAGQSTIEAAAKSTIAIMNSLGLSVEDLGRIQDVQFQVVRKGIINYEELSNVIGRALPATARAGQSFETLGAMIAFMTRNGLSAAMAATSAARALEAIAHPKTVKRLEEMGIKVRDMKGEFLPLIDIMGQMNEKIKVLSAPDRAKFLQELFTGAGGTIQSRRFWDTAFKNFEQFEEMLGFMENSTGTFESAYATMSGSVAAQSELIRNKWMLVQEALGRALLPSLVKLLTVLDSVLTWFDKLPQGTKEVIAQFILWGSVISILVGGLLVFVGAIAFVVSGIMAAGTALVVVIASVVATIAAITALGLAFKTAWDNSVQFRNAVGEVGHILKSVWSLVLETARDVAKAYEDNLQPSIEKLWNVIENKFLPVLARMMKVWREEVIPKLQEAKRIIVDLAGRAFAFIATIINTVVAPAVERLSNWWKENEETLRPFVSIIGQAVKWLLIIVAVLAGAPILAFIAAIAAVILIIEGLIDVIQFIVEWVQKLFNIWMTAWNAIVDAVKTAIGFISNIVTTALNFLYNNIWMPIWNMFAPLIKEVFGLIGDIFNFWITLWKEILKDWIMPVINFIVENFTKLKVKVAEIWNNIVTTISAALFMLYNTYIKPIVDSIKKFWTDHLQSIWDRAVEIWNKIVSSIKEKIQEIKDFFSGAGSWLKDAGKSIIQGLLDGITGKVKELRDKLKEITENIPDWKGPRSVDVRLLGPVGATIMKGLMIGIASQIPMLQQQLRGITTEVANIAAPSVPMPAVYNQQAQIIPEQKTINNTFNITTAEINPRVHAMELGFELESRL